MRSEKTAPCLTIGLSLLFSTLTVAGDKSDASLPSTFPLGYRHLLESAYVPAGLDQEVFDNLW